MSRSAGGRLFGSGSSKSFPLGKHSRSCTECSLPSILTRLAGLVAVKSPLQMRQFKRVLAINTYLVPLALPDYCFQHSKLLTSAKPSSLYLRMHLPSGGKSKHRWEHHWHSISPCMRLQAFPRSIMSRPLFQAHRAL